MMERHGGVELVWDLLGLVTGTIAGIIGVVVNVFPGVMQIVMSMCCGLDLVTVESIVFGEITTFNINFFNYNNKINGKKVPTVIRTLKKSVAKWFIILRSVAVVLSLLMLIYVGIRMALSTVASDKAKYKKMLVGWVESLVILFTLQYIISAVLNVGEVFSKLVTDLRDDVGGESFEAIILDDITSVMMFGSTGFLYLLNSIAYWCLVFVQTKFFFMYYKRLITVGFLILISPIITVTYSLDKIGDGKAQAFSVWLNEFMVNVFIQPIHAIIYLVFMFTAGKIASYSMIIAIIFLMSLTKVEKIVLQLFNLRNVVSLRPVDDERKKGK